MIFTRRRWDTWWLGATLAFLLIGGILCLVPGQIGLKALAFPLPAIVLWLWRFQIPKEGTPVPSVQELPRPERALIYWCAGCLVGSLPTLVILFWLIPARTHRHFWWLWAMGSLILMAVTGWFARRADLARRRRPPA